MPSIINDAFYPFRYLDMASFYQTYTQLIDGIIFFGLFLGLSKAVFRNHFKGKPGNAISIFFAAALTVGLLITERMFNFNLKSFGWLAAMTLLLVVGFFMFTMGHSFGLRRSTSLAGAYSILYPSIAFVSPNIFDFIATSARWINGLLGLLFLISFLTLMWRTFARILGKRHKPSTRNETESDISEETVEIKQLKSLRIRLKSIDDMIDALHQLSEAMKEENIDMNRIRRYLAEMNMKENILKNHFNQMERRLKQIGRIDTERLERMKMGLDSLPDKEKERKQLQIDIEHRMIEYDKTILGLKNHLDNHINAFNSHMHTAIENINSGHREIDNTLTEAKKALFNIKKQSHDIKKLEKELIDLHRKQKGLSKEDKRRRKT